MKMNVRGVVMAASFVMVAGGLWGLSGPGANWLMGWVGPPGPQAPNVARVAAAKPNPSGWVKPVTAQVWDGFRTKDRPTHQGVDLGAARGTPIRAAAAGVVVQVVCNVTPAAHGCDVDGGTGIYGCGWYASIRHAGNIFTRYCHMGAKPLVVIGQQVAAGDILGYVGSSGHSGTPHLHFEVRLGSEDNNNDAVDPVQFMAKHGAPLGP